MKKKLVLSKNYLLLKNRKSAQKLFIKIDFSNKKNIFLILTALLT